MQRIRRLPAMLVARNRADGSRLTLLARLLIALSVVLFLSGGALVWSIIEDEVSEQAQVLARRVSDEVRFAVPALSAPAIVGDFAAIEQMLRARAAQPFIEELVYRDARGHSILVRGTPPQLAVPEPVRGVLRLARLEEEGPIEEGGVGYGFISVTVSPNYASNQIWRKVQHQVGFVAATVISVLGIAFVVLASGLSPLRRLTEGARRFGAGDHRARIDPSGPPETEESIRAFNRMADSIESALASLRASEERNRLLAMQVEQSQDAIFLVASDGRVASWNAGATTLFGRGADAVLGRTATSLGLLETSMQIETDPLRAMQPRRHEDFARTARDARIPVSVVTTPLLDDRGVWLGELFVVRDISALKEVQAQLAAANEGLERRVAERTAQLEQARDAAEAASHAKGLFLANMSHEIRTPLNGVLGISELLANTQLDADQHQFLELITSSGRALLAVINDVLDFSKVEAGRIVLEEIEFSPVDCVGDAVRALSINAHEKHLEVIYHVDPAVPALVRGDPSRTRQIVLNLLGNAVKFTARGEVEVSLGVAPPAAGAADAPPSLHISVRDTGIGIPADKQRSVFEAFTQADSSTTRQFGGSGLGLSISAKLAELMHGEIRLESEEGRGSTFLVALPLPIVQPAPAAGASATTGKRVVVVERNAAAAAAASATLTAAGFQPIVVADAAGLARERAAGEPDVLILDARSIAPADLQPRPTGPVLVTSRLGSQAGASGWTTLAGVAHLAKPCKPAELVAALHPLIAGEAGKIVKKPGSAPVESAGTEQPIHVLVAEDNTVNQFLARNLLQRLGCTVELVGSGLEALAAVERRRFDLVLMDVQMPIMGGLEATQELRSRERMNGGHMPIVALTANAVDGDRERCLGAGMDDYIAKPFSAAQLTGVVERWVRRPRAALAAAGAATASPGA